MARNTGGLKRLKAGMPKREEVIGWFVAREGQMPGSASAFEDVLIRLHEHVASSNSSASAEYVLSQAIGSPKSTIKQEVPDSRVFEAYAESMAELGYTEEDAVKLTARVVARLKGE